MAFPFTPSKRPHEWNPLESNGRGKWQKTRPFSARQQNQLKVTSRASILRVLCPVSKFGSLVGKGGGIVTKIRQETGAKIRIEETVPGCDERVVVITGSEKDAEVSKEENKEDNKETNVADGDEDTKESAENNDEKEDLSALEGSKLEKPTSSAQKALLLVYDRLVEGEPRDDGGDEEIKNSSVSVRLLIFPNQVGGLLGKGGSVMKQLSTDSGALIRVLPKDSLPLCASPLDEIVQITGGVDTVRKAVQSVSQQILKYPPRDHDSFITTNPSGPSSHPFASFPQPEGLPPGKFHLPAQGPPFPNVPYSAVDYHSTVPLVFPNFHEGAVPGQMQVHPEPISYRMLCSNDKVGSVIGKGGSIVKTLQNETGCEVKVLDTSPESDDRIIVISGPALPGDQISPAQDAVLRVQERIVLAVPDNKEKTITSRLLVPSNQIGCLLGKGGAVITEMRKLSGAHIRILGKDQIPKSVAESEVVQITGEFRAVQDALLQITTRLRLHLFRDRLSAMNHTVHPLVDQMPPFGPFMGRREPSPPRLFSNMPPPFQNDSVGRPHEERSVFPQTIHGSGFPHGVERITPTPWMPQNMREGGGSMPIPDSVGGAPQRRLGGFPGGNQPAVITNTIVEVVVPRAIVPSIYGEDGFCLRRIREISEAKITITEPRPEATETVIIISGTPEQAHAAQSLLQAFVLSETVAS